MSPSRRRRVALAGAGALALLAALAAMTALVRRPPPPAPSKLELALRAELTERGVRWVEPGGAAEIGAVPAEWVVRLTVQSPDRLDGLWIRETGAWALASPGAPARLAFRVPRGARELEVVRLRSFERLVLRVGDECDLPGHCADPWPRPRGVGLKEWGRELMVANGCGSCHGATDGIGPALAGIRGRARPLSDGRVVVADDAYLRRALTDPRAEVVAGFEAHAMPAFELGGAGLDAVVAALASVEDEAAE